jgi:hypothetical protein
VKVKVLFRTYNDEQSILLGVYSDTEDKTADEKIKAAKQNFKFKQGWGFRVEICELL